MRHCCRVRRTKVLAAFHVIPAIGQQVRMSSRERAVGKRAQREVWAAGGGLGCVCAGGGLGGRGDGGGGGGAIDGGRDGGGGAGGGGNGGGGSVNGEDDKRSM